MSRLKLADHLSLPLETVTQKLAWLGVTGSGKTYGASKLAELFWHAGAQFIVIDPVGVWYGLRLAKDGKKPSAINIPIFGGLHGDVPLETTGGELMANLVVDKTLSVILDVSQFESDADKARFAKAFADRFFFRKKSQPSAVHLFIEECQEFVPQNPQRGEEQMLHAFIRMQKLGRNFGIGSSYLSQRPQEVNKKALNMAQTLFVFRTTGTHERTAIEKWIEDKSLDESIANDLPKIPTGHCHVWSPEFLKISETAHILEKETFNASATPEVGAVAKARELAPIDLDKVRTEMAATIEKAKADDPRELRKQIAELRKQVAQPAPQVNPKNEPIRQAKPVLTDADRALIEKFTVALIAAVDRIKSTEKAQTEAIVKDVESAIRFYLLEVSGSGDRALADIERRLDSKGFQKILDKLATVRPDVKTALQTGKQPLREQVSRPVPSTRSTPARLVSEGNGDASVGNSWLRRMLIALAQRNGLSRRQLGVRAGLSSRSGTFDTYLSRARTQGWIEGAGDLRITDAGLKALGSYEPLPEGSALLAYWLNELGTSGAARILRALANVYPQPLSRQGLGEAASLSDRSGTFDTYLSRLRTLELVEGKSEIRASEELF